VAGFVVPTCEVQKIQIDGCITEIIGHSHAESCVFHQLCHRVVIKWVCPRWWIDDDDDTKVLSCMCFIMTCCWHWKQRTGLKMQYLFIMLWTSINCRLTHYEQRWKHVGLSGQ